MLSIDTGMPSATTSGSTGCRRCSSSSAEIGFRPVGPGGFRADVDDVGALGDHPPGLGQRALGGGELPAVGK